MTTFIALVAALITVAVENLGGPWVLVLIVVCALVVLRIRRLEARIAANPSKTHRPTRTQTALGRAPVI